MLTDSERAQAAQHLLDAARTRKQGTQLSKTWPSIDFDDAYAIQSEVIRRRVAEGRKVIGHKIGLTSKAMQRSSGIDEPDYGVLLDDMMFADGAKVPAANFCVPRVEVELAFVLARPLKGPGVGVIDVLRATEYVIPSLELIDARLVDPRKIFDTISDNGAAAGIVVGGRPVRPDSIDLSRVGAALYKVSLRRPPPCRGAFHERVSLTRDGVTRARMCPRCRMWTQVTVSGVGTSAGRRR